jgi:hypothetical protein
VSSLKEVGQLTLEHETLVLITSKTGPTSDYRGTPAKSTGEYIEILARPHAVYARAKTDLEKQSIMGCHASGVV